MVNKESSEINQILQTAIGLETDSGARVEMNNVTDNITKFNEAVEIKAKEISDKLENTLKTSKDIINRSQDLEIMPIGFYILIKPYESNPYNKIIVSKGGLIEDADFAPTYKSNETGEIEIEENLMRVGQVLEVGPECKYIKEGDDVYYKRFNEVPIPFFKQGLIVIHENAVMACINNKLKDRLYGR